MDAAVEGMWKRWIKRPRWPLFQEFCTAVDMLWKISVETVDYKVETRLRLHSTRWPAQ